MPCSRGHYVHMSMYWWLEPRMEPCPENPSSPHRHDHWSHVTMDKTTTRRYPYSEDAYRRSYQKLWIIFGGIEPRYTHSQHKWWSHWAANVYILIYIRWGKPPFIHSFEKPKSTHVPYTSWLRPVYAVRRRTRCDTIRRRECSGHISGRLQFNAIHYSIYLWQQLQIHPCSSYYMPYFISNYYYSALEYSPVRHSLFSDESTL